MSTPPTPDGTTTQQPVADTPWRRVHPLTPLMRSWRTVATVLALVTLRSEDAIRSFVARLTHADTEAHDDSPLDHLTSDVLWMALAVFVAVLTVLLLLNWIAWRATSFRVTATSVEVRRGVVVKQHRNARLDRVQAVDVVQPLVPRLFGLAELSFDVAGSGSSHLRISMLKRADAEALREAMLARVRAAKRGDDARTETHDIPIHSSSSQDGTASSTTPDTTPGAPTHPTAPEVSTTSTAIPTPPPQDRHRPRTLGGRLVATLSREGAAVGEDLTATLDSTFAAYRAHPHVEPGGRIVHVPLHRILLASLLRFSTLFALAWLLFGIGSLVAGVVTDNAGAGWTIAFTAFLTAFGFLNNTVQSALKQANFSAALTPDGLLITQGVTSTERRLVPLDRVQAVGLEQPLLWRPFGWWRAHYNIATPGVLEETGHSHALLPVGSADDALAMLSLALPLTADGGTDVELTGDLLHDAMGSRPEQLHPQPRASRWLDPLSWRVNGWRRTQTLTLIRRGRLKRRVEAFPHARIQSLAEQAGPFQRRLGLATVSLHSTEGPLEGRMPRQHTPDARATLFELADVARAARTTERTASTRS